MSTPTKNLMKRRQMSQQVNPDGSLGPTIETPEDAPITGVSAGASGGTQAWGQKMERRTMMETPLGDRDADTYPRSTINPITGEKPRWRQYLSRRRQ